MQARNSHRKPSRGARPKRPSLTVREARAQIVHDELLAHPELVEWVEDIGRLPSIVGWSPAIRDAAVDDLVADGLIVQDAIGRLVVKPRRRV